jgi:asparagine synthase (glutamine-hydrolysing)
MFFALELRSPYLDHRLFEFSQKIPTKLKQNIFKSKILMREIIKDFVPKEIYKRRGKYGFTPPLMKWFDTNINPNIDPKVKEFLNTLDDIIPNFTSFYRNKIMDKKINNKFYINYKIRLFIFFIWWKEWIKKFD